MARDPHIRDMLERGGDVSVRKLTRERVKAGAHLGDLAETFIAEADRRLLAGDPDGCGLIIWQAVHDGVPIHELLRQAKELGAREALNT